MKIEKLIQALTKLHPLSESFKASLESLMTPVSLPKNYLLLESPKISDHAYFIDSGFAISYTYVKGRKCINWIWSDGEILFSAKSLLEAKPSNEFIELVLPSQLFCISRDNILKLFAMHDEANILHRLVMNQYLECARQHTFDLKNLAARDRYDKLLRKIPSIEQILSQEQIASYLGIAPQSLSRMKKNSG